MAFFKRIGLTKQAFKIDFQFISLTSSQLLIPDEWQLEWKRGPQTDLTKRYQFPKGRAKPATMDDHFKRISNFYFDKKNVWQSKWCQISFVTYIKNKRKMIA